MGEGERDASLLREVHHLLTQGKSGDAQRLLAQMSAGTSARRPELNYVHSWAAVSQGQWEMGIQRARELPVLLDRAERESLLANGSVRRRRPMCLLMLGEMARKLGYPEEAAEHLQRSLALLNERRMNIPAVRLLVHQSLGWLALDVNQTAQALQQFETARRLCEEDDPGPALSSTIQAGLCETQFRLERYEEALVSGKQALCLLRASIPPGCQENLLLLLSRISLALGDHASALAYVQDARKSASQAQNAVRVASTLLVLVEIQMQEQQRLEARASCEEALALLAATPEQPLYGQALFLFGKIAEAEWQDRPECEACGKEAQAIYEQALGIFTSRHDTISRASVSRSLAQLLEARGEPALALVHWKNAFQFAGEQK